MPNREPYVKPLIVQLHYSTEPEVAIAFACKTTGSSGAFVGPCRARPDQGGPFVPCQTLGS